MSYYDSTAAASPARHMLSRVIHTDSNTQTMKRCLGSFQFALEVAALVAILTADDIHCRAV